jgi:hypothetical protein
VGREGRTSDPALSADLGKNGAVIGAFNTDRLGRDATADDYGTGGLYSLSVGVVPDVY